MKRNIFRKRQTERRGVALIVVLGFLALMVMMAVAFLTQARTERMVSDATLDAQRGRELVRTGLAAAMNDYSVDLYDNRFMLPPGNTNDIGSGGNWLVYPSVAPTAASKMPGGQATLAQSGVYLMEGEAEDWLPRCYTNDMTKNAVGKAQWIVVREDPASGTSRILGRYAYVCFDMSGGIDANLIAREDGVVGQGDPTNRPNVRFVGLGTEANPTLQETVDPGEFKKLRTGWHGFDTLSEIIKLTDGHYVDGQTDFSSGDKPQPYGKYPATATGQRWRNNRLEHFPALDENKVTDLVPYSLSAYRGVWDWGLFNWKAGDVRSCETMLSWSADDWNTALQDVLGQVVNVTDTIKACIDFVDEDSLPQGPPNYPSVEAVPMFNEIKISCGLAQPATNQLVLTVSLQFETWYPFPSADNPPTGGYSITAPLVNGGIAELPADIWIRCAVGPPVDSATTLTLQGTPNPVTLPVSVASTTPTVAGSIDYTFSVSSSNIVAGSHLLIQRIRVPDTRAITMLSGGTAVDQMSFHADGLNWNMAPGETKTIYYEVDDPRLNHSFDRWNPAIAAGGSMGTTNGNAYAAGYGAAGGEGKYLYCRNGTMRTPGEFGFIPTGLPWETIDLCTPEGAKMLAKLVDKQAIVDAIKSPADNYTYYTNGTINPNTSSKNVLMAAFTGLYKRELPNMPDMPGPEDGEFTSAEASILAASITNEAASKMIVAAGGAFMTGADWVRVPAMKKGGALSTLPMNKNQREALIRNTWGLFSPNNSLFTVLVIGQTIKEGPNQVGIWNDNDDVITGERRAVALVWRDPTPSSGSGQHEMYVRMFKLLDQ